MTKLEKFAALVAGGHFDHHLPRFVEISHGTPWETVSDRQVRIKYDGETITVSLAAWREALAASLQASPAPGVAIGD